MTLTDLMTNIMQERPVNPEETILSHTEGVGPHSLPALCCPPRSLARKRNEPRNRLKAGFRVGKTAV